MSAYMRRFHEEIPGIPPLYHGYCSEHPDFGVRRCGTEDEIAGAVREHNRVMHGEAVTVSDTEYTPTTEDILRGFSAPMYKIEEQQRPGESFASYLGRVSVETDVSRRASEAAARRWLTAHDAEVAAKALENAADWFFNNRPNGQAYNGYQVSDLLRARAEASCLREGMEL